MAGKALVSSFYAITTLAQTWEHADRRAGAYIFARAGDVSAWVVQGLNYRAKSCYEILHGVHVTYMHLHCVIDCCLSLILP